jgi:RNA recognition motif-containing protein
MISNLDFTIGEADLRELCQHVGNVVEVKLIRDRWTGRSKGYGFVVFSLPLQATIAIEDMTGQLVKGRPICVKSAIKNAAKTDDAAVEPSTAIAADESVQIAVEEVQEPEAVAHM